MNKQNIVEILNGFVKKIKQGYYGEIDAMADIDRLADDLRKFYEEVERRSYNCKDFDIEYFTKGDIK